MALQVTRMPLKSDPVPRWGLFPEGLSFSLVRGGLSRTASLMGREQAGTPGAALAQQMEAPEPHGALTRLQVPWRPRILSLRPL